ncbi:hypothetical protein EXU85_20460 [Spirosoma sp. KCTC 42546]|uniref:hypothetical protein n=1 Tax=Spirosoma sp. KCTC 42546 TaxID=2520506 RepID=UPI0011596032|nr:hypothetical protein [Spirosoma sp. KCTC 42546]QDK80853.1 hypothetical protein EXU85_20460 [Spirosoma sp. KCTC 42546]
MSITHTALLDLGFTELFNRPQRYVYKGVTGRLQADTGTFHFHGFSPMITTLEDLKYMIMIIDYNHQATFVGYPSHDN